MSLLVSERIMLKQKVDKCPALLQIFLPYLIKYNKYGHSIKIQNTTDVQTLNIKNVSIKY